MKYLHESDELVEQKNALKRAIRDVIYKRKDEPSVVIAGMGEAFVATLEATLVTVRTEKREEVRKLLLTSMHQMVEHIEKFNPEEEERATPHLVPGGSA